jgi:glyceraldehyde 3-phosphate dehydrogenase
VCDGDGGDQRSRGGLVGPPEGSGRPGDAAMSRVVDGTLVIVMTWYDNEWGFSNQMVRTTLEVLGVNGKL